MSRGRLWLRLGGVLVLVACVPSERAAFPSDREPEAVASDCREVRVEVSVEPLDPVSDAWTGILEGGFEITVDVWNDCPGEISVLPGEVVPYESDLVPSLGETLQPRECLAGHLPVDGAARPGQAMRRTRVVEGCVWEAESEQKRSVRVEGGFLQTSSGKVPHAPVEVELP